MTRPILLLSVGLVVFTAIGVAVVVKWIIPDMEWALALAVGAIVAPPDAVAATAIARRIGLPRRIVTILEGSVEFRVGDDVFPVIEGDVIPVPAGTVHAPVHSAEGCLMISVFAPYFDPDNPDRVFID